MKRIEEEVEPQLPECELNKGDLKDVTPPARQMKQRLPLHRLILKKRLSMNR